MGMKMKKALPFVGMVVVQFAQVGLMIVGKKAMSDGMTNFTFVFYSNAIAALILLPSSFLIHRSNRPALTFQLVCGFLLLGLLGFLVQIFGYAGIQYASASLATAMLNLIPGFTFILAAIFRMEKVDFGSSSTLAKAIGTVVSVAGAFVVALYKGPTILAAFSNSGVHESLLIQPSDWVLGAFLLTIDCVFSSIFIITQAFILKKYPAELIVMAFYCFVVAILSAAVSLIVEKDLSSWSLNPSMRLIGVLYAGFFGSAFQVTVGAWVVQRTGPLFVSMFHPLGIVIATILGVIFLGDGFYFGSLVGSIVIVIGFYSVMWGKAKEGKIVEVDLERSSKPTSEKVLLLQNNVDGGAVQ